MNTLETLTLNGYTYQQDELLHVTEQKMKHADSDEEEFAIYSFIHQWLSASDTIEVPTSGSTGAPTLQLFRKEQFIESAKITCDYFKITDKTNMLLCLSANYIAGKMMLVRAWVSGANLITVSPSGSPLKTVEDKIDFAAMVPLQVQNSIADTKTEKLFASIYNVIIGGTSVSPKLAKALVSYNNNLYATFAMTETLSHIALKKLSGNTKTDVYELMSGISVSEDERGCLTVHAPHISEKPIVTNDIIIKVDDTHFHWLGRYDNVINSGGVKIYPETVETKIAHLLGDTRFFITSLPDETLGEKVVMVIENIYPTDINNLKAEIEKAVGKYEAPKEYYTVPQFAETPTGKVQRQETLRLAMGK